MKMPSYAQSHAHLKHAATLKGSSSRMAEYVKEVGQMEGRPSAPTPPSASRAQRLLRRPSSKGNE
jgi:hypothetical protein